MNTVSITAENRTNLGKKGTRAVRAEGKIPCVLYGSGDPLHFTVPAKSVKSLVYTPDFKVADISIDGGTRQAIVKDIQFHPVSEAIQHIDFLSMVEGTPIKVELPVRFSGVSPGVKSGGKLQQSMRRVKVKANPENLTEDLKVDIGSLQLGQSVRVRDIEVPEGVEIMSAEATPIATVIIPRALRSAATAEAKAAKVAK